MKSLLKIFSISAFLFFMSGTFVFAQYDYRHPLPEEKGVRPPHHAGMKPVAPQSLPNREDFERRLNLTPEQKEIARIQREKSIEKIKPLLEQIDSKKVEVQRLQNQTDSDVVKINQLEGEIRTLRKQVHEIRRENMKAFEASLSAEQHKEMLKMKEEGRKRFEEKHKSKTPVR